MISAFGRMALLGLMMSLPATWGIAGEGDSPQGSTPGLIQDALEGVGLRVKSSMRPAGTRQDEVGSGDKLKVTFFGNADLTGEVRVQSDGTITLPALGSFVVAGKTTTEIASTISTRFAQDARRASNNVTVEVVEWRPVFVTGGVSKPGAYAYMSDMTVLHAISMSGGFYRVGDGDVSTFINVTQNISRVQEMQEQLKHYLVRMASLQAEKAGETKFDVPQRLLQIASRDDVNNLVGSETRALALRLEALAGEREVRRRQIEVSQPELENYRKQLEAVKAGLRTKRQYLQDVVELAAKGYARRPDIINLEAHIERLENDRRDLMAQAGRVERELVKQEQEVAGLLLQRQIKIDEEMSMLQQRIGSSEAALEGAMVIVSQLGGENMVLASSAGNQQKRSLVLLRKAPDGKDIFVNAEFTTRLQPGDVVVVGRGERERPRGNQLVTNGPVAGAGGAGLLERTLSPTASTSSR